MRRAALAAIILGVLIALPAATVARAAERDVAGEFAYYALVLGWSPFYCLDEGNSSTDPECSTAESYGFLLHGLWPQYDRGWPEDCDIGKRPWVPWSVIEDMRDIMPGKGLVIHEYRSHGTCTGLSPAAFFAAARQLYERVSIPALFASASPMRMSPDAIEQAFVAANSWLKPEMMAVTCHHGQLADVRICFNRDLSARACGANLDQGRLCPLQTITVLPRNNARFSLPITR
jgi:ribonuclease T2